MRTRAVKVRLHDPILRIRFLVLKVGRRQSDGPISRFRFCGENVGRSFVVCSHNPIFRTDKESLIWCQNRDNMQNLSVSFIFYEECPMKIEHAHKIRLAEPTNIGFLKTDPLNRPLSREGY